MVGLVIVSHSRALAEALVDLVSQVAAPGLPLAYSAGVGENRQEFGTDAVEIMEAIEKVYSPDGVLVLMDLGSAILSAQMAVELLPAEIASKVRFCSAPLVEGAIAAGVQIGLNSDLDTVCREARSALLPKSEQIGEPLPVGAAPAPVEISAGGEAIRLTLTNVHGLHARPAAKFVTAASSFDAQITVTNLTTGKGPVSAHSLNAIATLGAIEFHEIEIRAAGLEASRALQVLKRLVEENFGEPAATRLTTEPVKAPQPASVVTRPGQIQAVPISDGIAFGPLFRYQPPLPTIPEALTDDPAAERARLEIALGALAQAIQVQRNQLRKTVGEADAAIFDAHLLILQDPELLKQVYQLIENQHLNAAAAWNTVLTATADSYRQLDDEYLRQRALDVEDVRNQMLFALEGKSSAVSIQLEEPVILYAQDITPTETSQLDMDRVLAIVTAGGGPTSHSAILARALGIPAVAGTGALLDHTSTGQIVAVDGFSGQVWIEPPENVREQLAKQRQDWLAERERLLKASQVLAHTKDHQRIEVVANIGNAADALAAVKNGAEGVGLLRTEFLFLTRQTPPSEDEQLAALRQIGEAMQGRPVVVRTLDVGGDKEVPYIHLPPEPNPFLGVRAIRLSLHEPQELFLPQLRAILRAAAEHPFKIMFPMVANVDEVRQARRYLTQAHEQLLAENLSHAWPVETGIMIEIPSAALLSQTLAKEVDFFSIGTNDLTQYTLAAERGNPMLAGLADALHPAVLRLIGEVAQAAHAHGRWTGVCGELAGDPLAVPVLVGLGVDELSLNPAGIPRVKSILRHIEMRQARELAEKILLCENSGEARQLAQQFADTLPSD